MAAVNDERAKATDDHADTYRIVDNAGRTASLIHASSVALEYPVLTLTELTIVANAIAKYQKSVKNRVISIELQRYT